jgi:heat-inducible transcriptional repressor
VTLVPLSGPRLGGAGGAGWRDREPHRRSAPGLPPGALEEASNYITAHLAGRTLGEAARLMQPQIASGQSARCRQRRSGQRGLAVWSQDAQRRPVLIVRGQANLLDDTALGDLERVRSLIDDLESKQSVAQMLDLAREAESTRIFIGARTGFSRCPAHR